MKYAKIKKMQPMARRFFIFAVLSAGLAHASSPAKVPSCHKRELELKSCRLEQAPYQLRLTADRVTVSDGTWKVVHELPLVGDQVEWQRVSLRPIGTRWFVEFELWTPPESSAEIQNLKWFVVELEGTSWTKRVEEIIQKRRRLLSSSTPPAKGPKYQLDRKESFGLELNTKGEISWTAGKFHGVL